METFFNSEKFGVILALITVLAMTGILLQTLI